MNAARRNVMRVSLLLAAASVCCTGKQQVVSLTEQERALGVATGIEEPVLLKVKAAGRSLRRLRGIDSGGEPVEATGVSIDVPHDEAAEHARQLQNGLPSGHFAFVSERHYGIGGQDDVVSVMKAADVYEVVRAMGTNGWNYEISPEMVITRLKEWDGRFGITLRGIAFDWLEADFKTPPPDMATFAKEVYAFCPDVVDQGTETVEALATEMKRTNTVYLWWD